MSGVQSALIGADPRGRTPAVLQNFFASAWSLASQTTTVAQHKSYGILASLSGAMTANTLKTALTVTGSGALNFFGLTCVDTTSRTMRIKITLDGVVVSDATSAAIVTTDLGGYPIGAMFNATSNPIAVFDEIGFVSSCLIEIASSVTETDKFNVFMRYRTN